MGEEWLDRQLPRPRFFPADAPVHRWLTSGHLQLENPPSFITVSSGSHHVCALRNDHTVECWGGHAPGSTGAPGGTFASVSSGLGHTCGLRDDQAIECWGHNNYGQADPPGGTFRAVAAGSYHTCGLTGDYGIEC